MIKKFILILPLFFCCFFTVHAEEVFTYDIDRLQENIDVLTTKKSERNPKLTLKQDLDERISYYQNQSYPFYVYWSYYQSKFHFVFFDNQTDSFTNLAFLNNEYNQYYFGLTTNRMPRAYDCEFSSSDPINTCDNINFVYTQAFFIQGQTYFYPYYSNLDVPLANNKTLVVKSSKYGTYTISKGMDKNSIKNLYLKTLIDGTQVEVTDPNTELKEKYSKKWAENMPNTFYSLFGTVLPICVSIVAIILGIKFLFFVLGR